MRVVGADWAAKKWAYVVLDDGIVTDASACVDFAELIARFPDASAIGVDIPIGLPERPQRAADVAARALVGGSTVFPTFPRSVYESGSHDAAVAMCRANGWSGISRQSYGLWELISEVDPHADRVHEVHQEVSFWAMKGGRRLGASKHTWNGFSLRRELLAEHGLVLPERLGVRLPIVDVLDAAAVAWTAQRIASGTAVVLPENYLPGEPTIRY